MSPIRGILLETWACRRFQQGGLDVSQPRISDGYLDVGQISTMGLDVYKSRNSVGDRTSGRVKPRDLMSLRRGFLLETGHLADFNHGS